MNNAPTVFIVDDDPAILKALERLLRAEGYETRDFQSAEEFLAGHDPSIPGCIVLDMIMPNVSGLALQQALRASGCDRFIVFMTGLSDIAASVRAMKDGAVDFLSKPFSDNMFLAAVRDAIAKDCIAREIFAERKSIRDRIAMLTPREYEVLQHIISGQLNKQIAADLGTVEKTIKVHRARVMEKMQVASLAELVCVTMRIGLPHSGTRTHHAGIDTTDSAMASVKFDSGIPGTYPSLARRFGDRMHLRGDAK
ncbi:DNA-binding response regulator [Noviherbaspirillum cavernae]|uniref:DNA-binding response regulator n=1 Tax=Noviherbaspirillum cavernae TaxID=2320862 RepID=A0A418X0Q1_9BURK|nr:response regulator [Noviherbaspirillum cavernae]RJG06070.1 DNA-binding response regulator [Noviherbaspirillum cavernae]